MRLIDADALRDLMEQVCWDIVEMRAVQKTIDEQPTIDAVPVVRCKDCQWKEEEQPGMVYCPATVGGWVDDDWFCKGGERSEECK